ncbi:MULTISPECIES: hypothetical protein [unclassified Neisseria]|uniref:hypothetical protein n=1 Tax=unclassified Neisseria TaxID=2623750 RepID=UPI00107212CE|nr:MULTISPECIES: hypothetical protein [unclassified Neisseria]MBF0804233.1 hypothetical protein [Neisseria sp. 19428wB4_WF04]TFU43025.1 hypothetical protein E4T99_07705 [Neisseria sp. WF04]
MRDVGIFMVILGFFILFFSGSLIAPKYLGRRYWILGKKFKKNKIEKDNKYYLDANFSYLDSLVIKGGASFIDRNSYLIFIFFNN